MEKPRKCNYFQRYSTTLYFSFIQISLLPVLITLFQTLSPFSFYFYFHKIPTISNGEILLELGFVVFQNLAEISDEFARDDFCSRVQLAEVVRQPDQLIEGADLEIYKITEVLDFSIFLLCFSYFLSL